MKGYELLRFWPWLMLGLSLFIMWLGFSFGSLGNEIRDLFGYGIVATQLRNRYFRRTYVLFVVGSFGLGFSVLGIIGFFLF